MGVNKVLSVAAVLLSAGLPSLAQADSCGRDVLEKLNGQQIEYQVSWKGMTLDSRRRFSRGGDGIWTVSNDSRLLFMALEERSRFGYDASGRGAGVSSLDYRYQRKGMSKKRDLRLEFGGAQYRSISERGTLLIDHPAPVYDLLNHQLQLQIDLACGAPQAVYSYPVARRDEVDHFEYRRIGTERINTPVGALEAVRLERGDPADHLDRVWLAPALDYAIVKLVRLEDDESAELVLTRHPGLASN